MSEDEYINKILNEVNSLYSGGIGINELIELMTGNKNGTSTNEFEIAYKKCLGEGLINWNTVLVTITLKGRQLLKEYGSYLNYLKSVEEEKNRKIHKEKKELQKLELDVAIANLQKKTFWWLFFIALVGAICGIISVCKIFL